MNPVIEFLVASLILLGAVFALLGSVGLARLHEIAVMVFLFITAPVSAHLLAKAALHRRVTECDKDVDDADE